MRRGVAYTSIGFGLGRMGREERMPVTTGIVIFAAGTAFGYSFAMSSIEPQGEVKQATADFIRTLKALATDAWLDVKQEMADAEKAAKATPEDIINGKDEQSEDDETTSGNEPDADEEPVVDVDDVIPPQGETP
jgi:hypothetical protein